jgi:hypothetical protein
MTTSSLGADVVSVVARYVVLVVMVPRVPGCCLRLDRIGNRSILRPQGQS